jgi:signal recognition particle subunit SRP54
VNAARLGGYDVLMLDTAGRTHVDEPLMLEMAEIKAATNPHEILLVADALTGQDAVNVARSFNDRVGVTALRSPGSTATAAAAPRSPCGPSPAVPSS